MKYIFTIALFFASIFSVLPAHTCSCIPILTFCESVSPENPVLLGVVTRHYVSGAELMDIQVLNWIKPTGTLLSHITIVGGNGANCWVMNGRFNRGDTIVLTPNQISLQHSPEINANHSAFSLSDCAVSFLQVNNGVVRGAVRDGLNSVHLSSFVSELGKCLEGVVLNDLKLFPNPAGRAVQVQFSGAFAPEQIRFFNVLGQEFALSSSLDETKGLLSVDVETLSAGVYFAVLQYGSYRRTFKWVKS